jgi:hypothetical protein
VSATTNDYLAELSPDSEGALYVIGGGGVTRGGTLKTLIPIGLEALRAGASRVDIQLADHRWLDGDGIRELLSRWVGAVVDFSVRLDTREVLHQPTGVMFRIEDGDKLTLLYVPPDVPRDGLSLIEAGAAEEVSRMRRVDPAVSGFWTKA